MPGIDSVSDKVEDTMVTGPVVTGDPGPVEREDHGEPVQPDVEVGLVEGAAEERGIDGDHGPEPGDGHAGRGGDGVLLGDADVEEPVGELGLEREEAGRAGHRGGDGHDLGTMPGGIEDGAGEGVGVGGRGDRGRRGDRCRLHLEVVEALHLVLFGRGIATTLLRDDVDDDGATPFGGVREGLLHARDVVTVDGPGVADPECLEEAVGRHDLAHRTGEAVQTRVRKTAEAGNGAQHMSGPLPGVDIGRAQAQLRQARRQPRHRRCIRPPVVVEDDDDTGAGVAEVVQCLVRHPAGERPVADDCHHVPVLLAPTLQAHGDAVRVAQGRRGVAVLDPVVGGLGTRRVARHPARLAQGGEAFLATRDELVDVGLVSRVPQDHVTR